MDPSTRLLVIQGLENIGAMIGIVAIYLVLVRLVIEVASGSATIAAGGTVDDDFHQTTLVLTSDSASQFRKVDAEQESSKTVISYELFESSAAETVKTSETSRRRVEAIETLESPGSRPNTERSSFRGIEFTRGRLPLVPNYLFDLYEESKGSGGITVTGSRKRVMANTVRSITSQVGKSLIIIIISTVIVEALVIK